MSEKDTLYARWLSGELSAEEMKELKDSGALGELEAIIKATDQSQLPALDADAEFEKFRSKYPPKSVAKTRRLQISWVAGIAASLLLIVAVIFVLSNQSNQLESPNGATQSFAFVDGSTVLLNDGSSLEYKAQKWDRQRIVQLSGEAQFDVEKGAPFIVKTRHGNIEVLGTSFNVRSWGDRLYVECFEGSVQVKSEAQELILSPFQSVLVDNGQMGSMKRIGHQQALWASGISRFYDENVSEVFAELERQYNVQIDLSSSLTETFSGAFEHDDLETALNNICKPLSLSFTVSEDKKTVRIGS